MRPQKLIQYLEFAIPNQLNVLIKGQPGIGKSDIVKYVANKLNIKLLISHPVVSDPTDFKGMPFASNGIADFLPFGDLRQLIETQEPLIWFIDDLGQSSPSVQAAIMQILLERSINGHRISDKVSIVSATNRKEDKAAVSGLLEPVKSRFASIVELEIHVDDWVNWALQNNIPLELIAFIRFRPDVLTQFKASKDIVNTPSPRTIANVGKQQMLGLDQSLYLEVFSGAAGDVFAAEYTGFLKLFHEIPSIDEIINNPNGAMIPDKADAKYAVSMLCAHKINNINIGPILTYIKRLGTEMLTSTVKDATIRNPKICNTREYIEWAVDNHNILMSA